MAVYPFIVLSAHRPWMQFVVESLKKITSSNNTNATVIALSDSAENQAVIEASNSLLEGRFAVWHENTGRLTASDLEPMADRMLAQIEQLSIKRASLVAFDGACNLAMVMLASNPQIVRRAVLVDPPGRSRPGWFERLRELAQEMCIVPLPFRLDSDIIDLRHLQHRISCPLVVVQTGDLDAEWSKQCREIAARAPNAWLEEFRVISSSEETGGKRVLSKEFLDFLEQFIEVPSKRPQKNLIPKNTIKKAAPETTAKVSAAPELASCANE